MSANKCTLRRCQGVRGCICPKGRIPVGCYGKSVEPPAEEPEVFPRESASPKKSPSKGPSKLRDKSVSPIRPRSAKKDSPSKPAERAVAEPKAASGSAGSNLPAAAETAVNSGSTSTAASASASVSVSAAAAPINGSVMIRYNHYKKQFAVTNGVCLVADVDNEYCLSFAFPNSKLHVSTTSPSWLAQQDDNSLSSIPLIPEDANGNFLFADIASEYWVHIEEDAKEKEEYEKRQAAYSKEVAERRAKEEADAANGIVKTKMESCSCIEGNPCVDKYCCKDWDNRYTVAKKNGWKGFQ